jgi:hypothetical protein
MSFVYNVVVITLFFVTSTTKEIKAKLFIVYTGTDYSCLYVVKYFAYSKTF